ncbi:MAG: hypothetical protein JWM72_444 [Actinomycetia bacterium]|nr:hypothetical protein [Actinomycetes bacterium]
MNETATASSEQRSAEVGSGFGIVDVALVLLLAATIVCFILKSSGYGLFADDWRLADRGQSLGDFFQPYNNNLSIVPIAVYRLLYSVFGFGSYLPLRVVGVVSGAVVAGALFLLVRDRLGAAPALIVAASMLWYPRFVILPVTFNYYFALTAAIYCAWLLTRESRAADFALVLALSFALCCSGVGVAASVGCLVYVAVVRAPLRRWMSVLVPSAAWGGWWLLVGDQGRGPLARTFSQGVEFVRHGLAGSFQGLVGGNRLLGLVLAVLFVVNLGWRVRRGPRIACHELAWSAALLFWWVALAYSRGLLSSSDAVRYRFVGSVLVILAFLPVQRPSRALRMHGRAAVIAGLVVAGLVVSTNHGGIFHEARALEIGHRRIRQNLIVANLGTEVVPDRVIIPLGGFASLSAGDYRSLVVKYGAPPRTRPERPDVALIALGGFRVTVVPGSRPGRCLPLAAAAPIPATSTTVLGAPDRGVIVQVRRFGPIWVTIGRVPPGATASIDLPGLQATTPWMLRASGACVVQDAVSVDMPKNGATVTGTTPLVASTSRNDVSAVEFRLTGGNYSDTRIGAAVRGYGWVYRWDSTAVPNGRYTLTSVATNSAGHTTTTAKVSITVHN